MSQKFSEMEKKELVNAWYNLKNKKSEKTYLALGVLAGVFGNIFIESVKELFKITPGSITDIWVKIIAAGIILIFCIWTISDLKNYKENSEAIEYWYNKKRNSEF